MFAVRLESLNSIAANSAASTFHPLTSNIGAHDATQQIFAPPLATIAYSTSSTSSTNFGNSSFSTSSNIQSTDLDIFLQPSKPLLANMSASGKPLY